MAGLQCSPRTVGDVKGFEALPDRFSFALKGKFTIEQPDPNNNHNEANFKLFCQPGGSGVFSSYKDVFTVTGGRGENGSYRFQFDIKSDPERKAEYRNNIPIYFYGRVSLVYDPKTGSFSYSGRQLLDDVKGGLPWEKKWLPCDIPAYFTLISGLLECVERHKLASDCDAEVAKIVAGGLKTLKTGLVDATVYTAAKDCVFNPKNGQYIDMNRTDPGW